MSRRLRLVLLGLGLGLGLGSNPPAPATHEPPQAPLFVLHPTMAGVGLGMEPAGRDRLTKYRDEAESLGLRGKGPCVWYRLAELERTAGQEAKANRDEAKAKGALPKERCSRWWY